MTADPTMRYAPDAARPADRAAHAFTSVENWLSSEPMAELLGIFAGHPERARHPLGEDLPEWLYPLLPGGAGTVPGLPAERAEALRRALAVERTAGGHFDFRSDDGSGYLERAQAVTSDLDPETRARITRLTDALGLVTNRPPRFTSYEQTLVLGGGYRSPLRRAEYAAELQASGIHLGEVSLLGSPRPLLDDPPERPAAEQYAPGAADEFDLMIGAVRTAFGLAATEVTFLCGCHSAQLRCPNWPSRRAAGADQTPAIFTHERRAELVGGDGRTLGSVLSASTGRPPLRPDTADTLALWARCARPRRGQRVLMVTTQVFVPFQAFDGLRRLYLPYGVDVDTVGFGADRGDRPLTAEYLLQETLSAIRSARRLLVDAAATLAGRAAPG